MYGKRLLANLRGKRRKGVRTVVHGRLFKLSKGLRGLEDLARANAGGAGFDALGTALHRGTHTLKVHIPATLRYVVSVADAVAELRPATTDITILCHKTGISLELRT